MEEDARKTEKAEILLKNLSAYISTMSFWVFAFVWNYLFEELEFVPRLGLGAALSWVVFLHVEAIGMIIMTLMKEKLQSEAEARVREGMRAEDAGGDGGADSGAAGSAGGAAGSARGADGSARGAGARNSGAGNHPRLAPTAERGARLRTRTQKRTPRPDAGAKRGVPATPPPPTPAAPPRARPKRPARARPRPYARPARARDGGTRRASPKA